MKIYGKNVNRLQMAIAMAARMDMMGCLGKVYAFNNSVREVGSENIWNLSTSGGTCQVHTYAENAKQIEKVVFTRNGFLYHGRVKALAEAAREAGLQF